MNISLLLPRFPTNPCLSTRQAGTGSGFVTTGEKSREGYLYLLVLIPAGFLPLFIPTDGDGVSQLREL